VLRSLLLTLLMLLIGASSAAAQEWAKKMFKTTNHNFGNVARGAKAEFAFELTNSYEEDIHIAGVRTSCGCTTPTITKPWLKTWEKGAIVAEFNTRSFLGHKSATITVTIDKPYFAEVQLTVEGFIRSDVVFDPGAIDFGEVDEGATVEKSVAVSYAGRSNWQIMDVRCANPYFEVELNERQRTTGRVVYDMLVRLLPAAPAGFIHDELTIVTDDQQLRNIPLTVEGHVASPLSVSPASLFLGVLEPGQTVTKQLVVRGKQPFKIVGVKCPDGCFEFKTTGDAKKLHFIPVTFTAGANPGKVAETIEIQTDLGDGLSAACVATATISQP
jgi:hypothetical protein